MKQFVNSSLLVVSLLLVTNLFFNSCDKDKNDPEKASIPLIASAIHYSTNAEFNYSESYQYDNQGRIIIMDDNDGYHSTIEYSGSTVTVKDYEEGELNETTIVQLNSKGLCTSLSWESDEEVQTYEYDNNGYLKSMTLQEGSSVTSTAYTVLEGNYVTTISTEQSDTDNSSLSKKAAFVKRSSLIAKLQNRILPEIRLKSATTNNITKSDFQFYKDKINTIEFENMGISFFGKQNKNPIKQETFTNTYNGEVYGPTTITYTYEYDTKDRITKQTSSDGDYSVYTYVD